MNKLKQLLWRIGLIKPKLENSDDKNSFTTIRVNQIDGYLDKGWREDIWKNRWKAKE